MPLMSKREKILTLLLLSVVILYSDTVSDTVTVGANSKLALPAVNDLQVRGQWLVQYLQHRWRTSHCPSILMIVEYGLDINSETFVADVFDISTKVENKWQEKHNLIYPAGCFHVRADCSTFVHDVLGIIDEVQKK